MLNEAGFNEAKIFLSNDLDEIVIWQIIEQIKKEAPLYGVDTGHLIARLAYGVGTRMITSQGKSSLDRVYKLAAVKDKDTWLPAIKVSESPTKTVNPGYKNAWRIYDNRGKAVTDLLTLQDENPAEKKILTLNHPVAASIKRILKKEQISNIEPLLVEILDEGKLKYDFPSLEQIRSVRDNDLGKLDDGVKRLINPHNYHVSLSDELSNLKQELIHSSTNAG
jgi:nicotinate phosphoribosyltransferase